ncbi:MAG: hypothetical protein H0X45_11785, partial [Planctomycetes bacterium]|nr:hypothetical protein [Planctomycetota bacterium]
MGAILTGTIIANPGYIWNGHGSVQDIRTSWKQPMQETFDDLRLDRVEVDGHDMRSGYVHRKCIPWAIVVQPVIGAYVATGPER